MDKEMYETRVYTKEGKIYIEQPAPTLEVNPFILTFTRIPRPSWSRDAVTAKRDRRSLK